MSFFLLRPIDERTCCAMVVSTDKMSVVEVGVWKKGGFLHPPCRPETSPVPTLLSGTWPELRDIEDTPPRSRDNNGACVAIPGLRSLPR